MSKWIAQQDTVLKYNTLSNSIDVAYSAKYRRPYFNTQIHTEQDKNLITFSWDISAIKALRRFKSG